MRPLPKDIEARNQEAAKLIAARIDGDAALLLKSGAERIRQEGRAFNSGQAGAYDGVYRLPDGRILEVFMSHGWMPQGVLFRNESDWNAYSHMPRNVWWEG